MDARLILVLTAVCLGFVNAFDVRQHLATKTPYWSEGSTAPTTPPDECVPIHINTVARHGSRDPTKGDIKAMDMLAARLKQYGDLISNDTFSWMKSWTDPYPLIYAGYLSYNGELEHYNLAQRFERLFSPLLSQDYYPNVYVLQSTQVPRTGVSAVSFAYGFTEGDGRLGPTEFEPFYLYTESKNQDVELRFFDVCEAFVTALDNGTISDEESQKYIQAHFPKIAKDVANRLGVGSVWDISLDELDAMFTACAFEVAVQGDTDRWCRLFTQDEIEAYEYSEDLATYYERGYGNDMSYHISSPLLQDIVSTIDGVISGSQDYMGQLAYLRFAHAETILPLVSLLGLFRDSTKLTADSSPAEISGRKWRSSEISPFTANIAIVLYNCSSEYRVKLLHNEVEYDVPGCQERYCKYDTFKSLYASALSYNFTQECMVTPSPSPSPGPNGGGSSTITITPGLLIGCIILAFAVGSLSVFGVALWYLKSHRTNQNYRRFIL